MVPVGNRPYQYSYRVRIEKETTPALQELAAGLGFISDAPGYRQGSPSPGAMLDALAAAYRRDNAAVVSALREIGVTAAEPAPEPTHD